MTVGDLKLLLEEIPEYLAIEIFDTDSCKWVDPSGKIRVVGEINLSLQKDDSQE